MLKFRVIVVDRTRSPFLKQGEFFYLERLRKYTQVEWIEVKPAKIQKGRSSEEILVAEGQKIARTLADRDYFVALDRSGDQYDSKELSNWLNRLSTTAGGWICFIIGGPLGLSSEILERSQKILSLSNTLTDNFSPGNFQMTLLKFR